MAHADPEKRQWDDDDRFYSSGSHSDDSPILSLRCEKRRYNAYTSPSACEQRTRKSTCSALGKFCLFCAAMILFCALMYIPVYNKANYHIPRKGFVSGWSVHTNRDTKIYVQPNKVTTMYEPKDICRTKDKIKKPLLLVIVCSAADNFERRSAIRDTWGSYINYKNNLVIFNKVREKYKDYNYKFDLFPQKNDLKNLDIEKNNTDNDNVTYAEFNNHDRIKRDISSFNQLLPALAKALSNISVDSNIRKTDEVPEKRFEDDDDGIVPGFDMNKELDVDNTENIVDFDYDYDTNIMKIPPKGYEDDGPDLNSVLDLLKRTKDFDKIKGEIVENNDENEFKLVFLLGTAQNDNGTIQKRIEDEIAEFDDVIQEGFVDSYNNLTLKSIMMLKWVATKCNDSVRYILKTDDDTYVNVPNLILNLKNRSATFDKMAAHDKHHKEYLLLGDVISGAKPVLKPDSKWYSPRYMYGGRVYPRYLSGMGYAMSVPTAMALYHAALRTRYFHLEDIYITGICALRASPRITAQDEPLFSYLPVRADPCSAHAQITAHRVTPDDMRAFNTRLLEEVEADRCERIRLTKVRQDQLRRKMKLKKKTEKASKFKKNKLSY